MDVLFAGVHLPQEVGGGLVFAYGSDDPLLALLEAALGQREVCQLRLHIPTVQRPLRDFA